MQIKHSFFLLLIVGLCWTGILFAHQAGPDPAVNGIFGTTCAQAGCHTGNPLNAALGSLTLSGLPSQWTPGQTYPLTVTVQRTGAMKYGFQLSAVSDSNNAQAGTLAATTNRAKVITGGGIQYAEHNILATVEPFTVNWTAPASASAGAVRFNLAGNAANGDGAETGDFIYTRVDRVSPLGSTSPQITNVSTSPNPPLANQTFSFTIIGSNFDSGGATISFTGPGCTNGCPGAVASVVPTQITGSAQLPAGSFGVVVRNTNTGAPSNSVTLGVTTAVPFALNNLSGTTQSTDGSGNLAVGYGTIQPAAGNTTPSGVLIFGYRQNNVLVTESGVPASPAIQSGRIFARVSANSGPGSVNTGIAIVNPNASFANVAFHFANTTGDIVGSGTCLIGPNRAIGQFLNESSPCPFNMSSIQGTFTFTSDVPVSAVALRSFIPEDGVGALYSTLPVVDTSVSTGVDPLALAHFADGTEWTTEVVLVNPTSNTLTGTLQFFVDALNPFTPIATDKGTQNSFSYSIPRESSYTLKTLGRSNPLAVGSVRITPTIGVAAPSAMLIFSHKPGGGVTVADAGVPSIQGTSFRMYYELSGGASGGVQSAVAVANLSPGGATVDFEAYAMDGRFVASGQAPLLGNGHVARSVDELFPGVTLPTRGILRISGTLPGLSVVGIRSRYNELGKYLFTTTPATNEVPSTPPTAAPLYFPRLVNGGSWSTQYVLFSGSVGQASTGVLQFYDINGAAINLPLN